MIKSIIDLYRKAYQGLPRRSWVLFGVMLVNSAGMMVLFFLSLYLTRRLRAPQPHAAENLGKELPESGGSTGMKNRFEFLSARVLVLEPIRARSRLEGWRPGKKTGMMKDGSFFRTW